MATPIRIKRSAVAGKKPTTSDLQLGELAVNFNDGKVFLKQDTSGVGVGTRIVEVGAGTTTFAGKTLFVTENGNDDNDGLNEGNAKATIKSAVAAASEGDTIKVFPGTYVENNPINLPDNVSVEGTELRRCVVTPQNGGQDLFYVSQGCHLTDLSFVGAAATNNSAAVSFRPLAGVSSDRFFDAARLIRENIEFIADETIGYLESTDYQNPAISVDNASFRTNINHAMRSTCHDITRGGNSKSIGAGQSYFTGDNLTSGIGATHIAALEYSVGIARSCINNIGFSKTSGGNYQTNYTQVKDLSIQTDGASYDIGNCANVLSAVTVCVGIVTGIIQNGINGVAAATGFTTNFPGNSGAINSGILDASLSPLQGTGIITKGPYIRNCTNFIPDSIGARIDGFNADEGDQINRIGVQGSFNVDSYTQYNQGGIGVSVSNGAYCQLVSLFTICNDIAVSASGGGQLDLTNSNSSFGTQGLIAFGRADETSKCIDRYTGIVTSTAAVSQSKVVVSGVGSNRPYDGQAIFFDRKYNVVRKIDITNGGSGYTSAPTVTVAAPTGPGVAVRSTASATVENGVVTAVTLLSSGSQYEVVPAVTFSGGGGADAAATAVLDPIYYEVGEATEPSAGISTLTLVQNLNNEVGVGSTVFFARQSLQIVSSHSFQYIGAGNTIELAYPSQGGVVIQDNEVIETDGARVVYTSTDQSGNFRIGDGVEINQSTGTISGSIYVKSLFSQVTPFILALGGD
jgi:hypothetical protein